MTDRESRREALLIQVELVVLKKLIHHMKHDERYRAQHEKTIATMLSQGYSLEDIQGFFETHVAAIMASWVRDDLPLIVADIADTILAGDHASESA